MSSMTIIIIQNNISKTRYVIFFRFNRHSESKINSDRVNKIIAIKMNSSFSIEVLIIINNIIIEDNDYKNNHLIYIFFLKTFKRKK